CPESNKKCHLWTIVDLGFFILMGVGGGLLGATFNCINKRLAKYRMRNVHPKPKLVRVLESLLVCLTTTLVIFVASMLLGECRPLSSADHGDNSSALSLQDSSSEEVNSSIKTFFCHNNTYNDMATLFFNPQESAILQLFHQEGPPQPGLPHPGGGEARRAGAAAPARNNTPHHAVPCEQLQRRNEPHGFLSQVAVTRAMSHAVSSCERPQKMSGNRT
ncbi:chloride transport protein 6-like, partial [Notechis scutatus]|uniref:Chloride transport protein 6-like n=1 Tax=Notechis scutatus TaxID=8663 RepID=A0A6J1VZL4_9SAUR